MSLLFLTLSNDSWLDELGRHFSIHFNESFLSGNRAEHKAHQRFPLLAVWESACCHRLVNIPAGNRLCWWQVWTG